MREKCVIVVVVAGVSTANSQTNTRFTQKSIAMVGVREKNTSERTLPPMVPSHPCTQALHPCASPTPTLAAATPELLKRSNDFLWRPNIPNAASQAHKNEAGQEDLNSPDGFLEGLVSFRLLPTTVVVIDKLAHLSIRQRFLFSTTRETDRDRERASNLHMCYNIHRYQVLLHEQKIIRVDFCMSNIFSEAQVRNSCVW